MNPMKTAPVISLSDDERRTLESWSRGRRTPARLVLRAKIVLAAAEGTLNKDIAARLGTSKKTVSLWRQRFAESRVAGIETDAPRPGRNRSIPAETLETILRKTTREKPAGATHWSTRTLAKAVGVSRANGEPRLASAWLEAAFEQNVQGLE
jgi:transposase